MIVRLYKLILPVVLGLLTAGCANTHQARDVNPSGFLQDYSILQKGAGDEALYRYWRPGVRWDKYTKVTVDPVVIVNSESSQLNNVMQAERERLRELLGLRLREALLQDFHVVARSGPGVLRVRAALTEAQASTRIVDGTSVLATAGNVITGAGQLLLGTYNFISTAGIEGEITDSETGLLLAAAVDRRMLGKSMASTLNNWDEVDQNFIYWSQLLSYRLCQRQGFSDCWKPD